MRRRTPGPIASIATWVAALAIPAASAQDPAPPAFAAIPGSAVVPAAGPSAFIIVGTPADLSTLIGRMNRPDFVVLDGPTYERWKAAAATDAGATPAGAMPAVDSLVIRGRLDDREAALELVLVVRNPAPGPVEVALGLDEAVLTEALDGGRDAPVRRDPAGGWRLALSGPGRRDIVVRFRALVKGDGPRRTLDVAIPECAATRVDLECPPSVSAVRLDDRDPPLEVAGGPDGAGRIRAALGPRARLRLDWALPEPAPGVVAYEAQGNVTLGVEAERVRFEGRYAVRVERGTLDAIRIVLDPAFQAPRVDFDGVPVQLEEPAAGDAAGLSIVRLPEPLRAGDLRRLAVRAERAAARGEVARGELTGVQFPDASSEAGWVVVRADEDRLVSVTPKGRMRPADARAEVPSELRPPAGTDPAFRYAGRPAALGFEAEPARSWSRVESSARVTVAPDSLALDLWLDVRTSGRPLREFPLELPADLVLDAVGPAAVVESTRLGAADEGSHPTRRLVLALTERAGAEDGFALHLVGRVVRPAGAAGPLPWVRPLVATSWIGTISLEAAPGLEVVLEGAGALGLQPGAAPSRAGASVSPVGPSQASPRGWFRHDSATPPPVLATRLRPPTLRARSTVDVLVDRHEVRLQDQVELIVEEGFVASLDLSVPSSWGDRWETEGLEVSHREELPPDRDGHPRARLNLVRPVGDRTRFRLVARRPLSEAGPPSSWSEFDLGLPALGAVPIESRRVRLASRPGVEVATAGPGWRRSEPDEEDGPPDEVVRYVLDPTDAPGEQVVRFRAPPEAPRPESTVSRLRLVTRLQPDGSVLGEAWAVVSRHRDGLPLRLPEGATWLEATVGTKPIETLARSERPGEFLVVAPRATDANPPVVRFSYRLPARAAAAAGGSWAPVFPGSVLVEEAYWEVRVPGNWSVLSVPDGWIDANRWSWDRYVFRRVPVRDAQEQAAWLAGVAPGVATPGASAQEDGWNHYLFRRLGGWDARPAWVVARPWLVGVCSGIALLLGLAAIFSGRALPPLVAGGALALIVLGAARPTLTIQLAQSAFAGLVLSFVAGLLHRATRRRPSPARPAVPTAASTVTRRSEAAAAPPAGAEDPSTIIRPRAEAAGGSGSATASAAHGSDRA